MVTGHPGRAGTDIRQPHYLVAEHVLSDKPTGRVRDRPSLKILRKIMRPRDKLIPADERALGVDFR